ncbi:hypothetical protein M5K25_008429 [Dendrobium thyrsiflorum]|uniref:Retrotransposon Copia-like N-terminal domain-containing protein n=1 Tax=Dendrobium thyrsiflorum TaxID=117978 RepID=A0ABD0V978_DENTH
MSHEILQLAALKGIFVRAYCTVSSSYLSYTIYLSKSHATFSANNGTCSFVMISFNISFYIPPVIARDVEVIQSSSWYQSSKLYSASMAEQESVSPSPLPISSLSASMADFTAPPPLKFLMSNLKLIVSNLLTNDNYPIWRLQVENLVVSLEILATIDYDNYDWGPLRMAKANLLKIQTMEDVYWKQKAAVKHIVEGSVALSSYYVILFLGDSLLLPRILFVGFVILRKGSDGR